MKIVVSRVKRAQVVVEEEIVAKIAKGLVLLVGFEANDTLKDMDYLAQKVINLRIFEDEFKKMNLNLKQVDGKILSVSQFTLAADTRKGNRPSFIEAMEPQQASDWFNRFNEILRSYEVEVETGIFQAEMNVEMENQGPVTILLESKGRIK